MYNKHDIDGNVPCCMVTKIFLEYHSVLLLIKEMQGSGNAIHRPEHFLDSLSFKT